MENDVTVPVGLDRLRAIEWEGSQNWHSCLACGMLRSEKHKEDCWLSNAIACARSVEEWRKSSKVGDRVRLVAMPETAGEIQHITTDPDDALIIFDGGDAGWRHLSELMPEEG